MGLAHEYGFQELESAISDYLKDSLCANNVCIIYDMASLYNLRDLSIICEDYIDKNATTILNHETFLNISDVSSSNINFIFLVPRLDYGLSFSYIIWSYAYLIIFFIIFFLNS